MKKNRGFCLVLILILLLSACGEAPKETESEKESARPRESTQEAVPSGTEPSSEAPTRDEPVWPIEPPAEEWEEDPFVLREDLYRVLYSDADKQEFGYLSADGFHVLEYATGFAEWWRVLLAVDPAVTGLCAGNSPDFLRSGFYFQLEGKRSGFFGRVQNDGLELVPANFLIDPSMTKERKGAASAFFSLDGESVLWVDGTGSTIWNVNGKEIKIADYREDPYLIRSASGVLSPDGRTLLCNFAKLNVETGEHMVICTLWSADGTSRELGEGIEGIAVSDGGALVYARDVEWDPFDGSLNPEPHFYVWKNGAEESDDLEIQLDFMHSYFQGPDACLHSLMTIDDDWAWLSECSGWFFNLSNDQLILFGNEAEEGEHYVTWYSEAGGQARKLYDEMLFPVLPYRIAVQRSGSGGQIYGIRDLTQKVYHTESTREEDIYLCDLVWVDGNWNTEVLDRDVIGLSLNLTEDGRYLSYVKGDSIYRIDLAEKGKTPRRLVQGVEIDPEDRFEPAHFLVSNNGENILWFDADGAAYTLSTEDGAKSIRIEKELDFDNVRPAGKAGFLYVSGDDVWYTESGTGSIVANLIGQLTDMRDVCSLYVCFISEDETTRYHYFTNDGENVAIVYMESLAQ